MATKTKEKKKKNSNNDNMDNNPIDTIEDMKEFLKNKYKAKDYNADSLAIKHLWNNNFRLNFYKTIIKANSSVNNNEINKSIYIIVKKNKDGYEAIEK